MSTLYRQRTAFEKELLAELNPLVKKSKWKKSSCALFNQSGDHYQDVLVSVHRNAALTTAELRFKPMALDPILWEILDIPENKDKPLSFRTWGAFTCSGLPILEVQLEQPGNSPGEVASKLVNLCNDKVALFQEQLAAAPFSNLIAGHTNHVERGAYAVTLVVSLINDGNLGFAYRTASSYVSGELSSCAGFTSAGKSFHQLALEWLDAGQHSRFALHAAAAGA
jgi:hypothetical protein